MGIRNLILVSLLGGGSILGADYLLFKEPVNVHNKYKQVDEQAQPQLNSEEMFNKIKVMVDKSMPVLEKVYRKGIDCSNKVNVDTIISESMSMDNGNTDLMSNVRISLERIISELKKCS